MPFNAFSNPDNMIVTGQLTVQHSKRLGNTGVSFDDGLIVSDGLGDLVVGGSITAGSISQPGIYNVVAYGADPIGVKDSTTAIQNAINAASVSGGIVYLPAGTYKTSAALTIPKGAARGTSMIGAGIRLTFIKPVSGANFNVVQTQYPPNNTTGGYTYSYLVFSDFTIDGSQMSGTTAGLGNGLYLFGGIFCLIRRVNAYNIPNWGIILDATGANDCYWSWVEDCIIEHGCAAGIMSGYSTASTITGCTIADIKNATAASQPLFSGPKNTSTNAIYGGSQQGRIINNIIGTGSGTSTALNTTNVENVIMGNYFISCGGTCIHNAGNSNTIVGNIFENPGANLASVAIIPANNDVYTGNTFYVVSGSMTYAFQNSSSNVAIVGNRLVAGSSGVLNPQSSAIWHISGNSGYNPVGPLTAPSVPSSTVAQTNTFGVDCTVFVNGGTVTVVAIGGTTTGQTSGPFRVPSGQTITLTYSAAPTWTWFGD